MGLLKDHLEMSSTLEKALETYRAPDEWPIIMDAGFYTVYHMVEAIHALDCTDTSTFADGFDLLDRILVPQGIGRDFVSKFEFLFYFRRGAIYGAHFPSEKQVRTFIETSKAALRSARAFYEKKATSP